MVNQQFTGNLINFASVFEVLSFPYFLSLLQISMNVSVSFFFINFARHGLFPMFAGNWRAVAKKCTHLRRPGYAGPAS